MGRDGRLKLTFYIMFQSRFVNYSAVTVLPAGALTLGMLIFYVKSETLYQINILSKFAYLKLADFTNLDRQDLPIKF